MPKSPHHEANMEQPLNLCLSLPPIPLRRRVSLTATEHANNRCVRTGSQKKNSTPQQIRGVESRTGCSAASTSHRLP
ncbi:hypothetical protein NPIL_392091 [Nephila pilipes]|uniref:Uncharacterized protein n=1 Tax=Nephila pilipes TaxID=299642 RepID=A0A8X6N824_NEPPI|nr:hypothetical protein NPIL_392091 [Nephila pilipes]